MINRKVKNVVLAIAAAVVVLFAGVLGYAATKPNSFRIERSATIDAPPEKVFALIDDLPSWVAWSPFEGLDPALKKTYSGPSAGVGATYAWEGNDKAGKGQMKITESSPPSKIVIKLDFDKPFEAHNIAEFTLEPKGDSTTVTWAMHGPSPYVMKVMTLFFSMDDMVGNEFATGLANLKAVAEKKSTEGALEF
jgi:uncharacterized protein YndB with AHSA1/START domain